MITYLPNMLTTVRLLLSVPVSMAILSHQYRLSLLLLALAAITDAADGHMARKLNCVSSFGAFCDPVADKLLMASCTISLTVNQIFPVWFTGLVLSRHAAVMLGACLYYYYYGAYRLAPTWLGKANLCCEVCLVLLTLMALAGFRLFSLEQQLTAMVLVSMLACFSFLDYFVRACMRQWRQ